MSGFRYVFRVPRALLVLVALLLVAGAPVQALPGPSYAVTGEQSPEAHTEAEVAAPRPAPRPANSRRPLARHPAPGVVPARSAPWNACPPRAAPTPPPSAPLLRTVVLRC